GRTGGRPGLSADRHRLSTAGVILMNQNTDTNPGMKSSNGRIAVLLIDDQAFVGTALGRLLATEADIELHCCHAPLDALTRANQIRPSLILQDLVMPEIDGLTLVRMFRNNPTTSATPIVVLSGDDDASARTRAEAAGANGYLVKLPVKSILLKSI